MQHQQVVKVLSLVIEPIYIKHNQVTCIHCQHQMTKLCSQKDLTEITVEDMKHPGKLCHGNSKHGPNYAEVYALKEITERLLIDNDTEKFLINNDAILGLVLISNEDAKGPKRFFEKQVAIVQ